MQSTAPRQSDSGAAAAGGLSSSWPEADDTPTLAVPIVQPAFGGAVAGRLVGNDLFVSYSGPSPFGEEIDELLRAVAFQLQWVRSSQRIPVFTVCFKADFTDLTGDADEADDGADE